MVANMQTFSRSGPATRRISNCLIAARDGQPVLLKRGLSMKIEEWLLAANTSFEYNCSLMFCERGVRTSKPTRATRWIWRRFDHQKGVALPNRDRSEPGVGGRIGLEGPNPALAEHQAAIIIRKDVFARQQPFLDLH